MKILNQKSLESLESSGERVASNVNQLFFNKEKEKNLKKALTLKFITCLILTNFMTYQIFDGTEAPIEELRMSKSEREIALTLNLYIQSDETMKEISIFNSFDELIIQRAMLIKKLNTNADGETKYLIRIPTSDIEKIRKNKSTDLHAYPFTNIDKQEREIYEFDI